MIGKTSSIKGWLRRLTIGLICSCAAASAMAQGRFPSKPVRIVVAFGAGGVGDLLARALGSPLGEILGQPVIIENLPGGSGITGTRQAAAAPGDGYTILQYATALALNQIMQSKPPYDLLRDFTPLSYTCQAPLVLLTPAMSPNKKVAELVSYAKGKPQGATYGHGGTGSVGHLSAELFKRAAGIEAVGAGYKGNGPAMVDLIGGRLDFYFATVADARANIKSGQLNALAVTSPQRDPVLPDVPTMVELGYKDFTPMPAWGYMVPRGTPEPIVRILQDAFTKAIATPAFQERLAALGANSAGSGGPDVLRAHIQSEQARWDTIIKAAQIQAD